MKLNTKANLWIAVYVVTMLLSLWAGLAKHYFVNGVLMVVSGYPLLYAHDYSMQIIGRGFNLK